jgi:hypothetical protein
MKKGEFQELLTQLHVDLRGMDLPPGKHTPGNNDNLRWLARNLGSRNAGHEGFATACETLKRLGHPVSHK